MNRQLFHDSQDNTIYKLYNNQITSFCIDQTTDPITILHDKIYAMMAMIYYGNLPVYIGIGFANFDTK
jgi:hypothetical protein